MDYKESLLMPKTDFQMRGNLPENEQNQRKLWKEMNLYQKMLKKNEGNKTFILHDGPPYANGSIHLGHALNKILKDFIIRSKSMLGYYAPYIPGWDTHGLPIEQAITNSGVNRKEMTKLEFRKLCHEYALKQIELQKKDFQSLNVIGDYEHPYITLQKEMEARQIEVFKEMAKKGLIYKGLKPVYWSPSSESALAEAEIEYKDRRDPSIFVAFPIVEGNNFVEKNDNLVIWTTTPWTLPGNLAIAVGEKFSYSKVSVDGKNYIMATELVDSLCQEFEFTNYQVTSTFMGSDLVDVTYHHPLMDRNSKVVLGHHVTLDSGSGLVHIAPSYGADDFIIGNKYNLGMVNGVNDQGILTEESGEFQGLYFEDANKEVTKKLEDLGILLKLKMITHSYPHDWRTKKPVIFRATPQWFCSIDKIRGDLLKEIDENITWHPEWGRIRLHNMIADRGDWCISRQRVWGVPLPIFYNEDGSEILDEEVMQHIANLFREYGSDIWFEKSAKELLPVGYTNPKSPNGNFTKEEDIMDVWFDSGSTHTSVLVERGLPYPADLYLEGSDQYRGWFNSSLICGYAVHGKSPYNQVASHGFTLDGKGVKMSKSIGNTIAPSDIVEKDGADILRLWVASVDYTEDMKMSPELLDQVKESYRKIRNTYRFLLGNLFDFDPGKDKVDFNDMAKYDQYMMVKLNETAQSIINYYQTYEFQEIYKTVNNFVSFTLSNFYLDFTKDILYIEKQNSKVRRSVQTVIYEVLDVMVRLLAPILPYTSEEVYRMMPLKDAESVHLLSIKDIINYKNEEEILTLFDHFFEIKDDVYKALEEARSNKVIGKGLEARVYLNVDKKYQDVLTALGDDFKRLFIVSDVILTTDDLPRYQHVGVKVEAFEGVRCQRCWNYFKEDEMVGEVCHRCHDVVEDSE